MFGIVNISLLTLLYLMYIIPTSLIAAFPLSLSLSLYPSLRWIYDSITTLHNSPPKKEKKEQKNKTKKEEKKILKFSSNVRYL